MVSDTTMSIRACHKIPRWKKLLELDNLQTAGRLLCLNDRCSRLTAEVDGVGASLSGMSLLCFLPLPILMRSFTGGVGFSSSCTSS